MQVDLADFHTFEEFDSKANHKHIHNCAKSAQSEVLACVKVGRTKSHDDDDHRRQSSRRKEPK